MIEQQESRPAHWAMNSSRAGGWGGGAASSMELEPPQGKGEHLRVCPQDHTYITRSVQASVQKT